MNWREILFLAVFAALPPVGLAIGPAYAPMLFGLATILTLSRRSWPDFDRALALLALAFLAVCAIGLLWSVSPPFSGRRLGQLAGIWIGCLALLALPDLSEMGRFWLRRVIYCGIAIAALLLSADTLFDFPLQRLLTGGAANAAYKYNRGLIALVLIAWPTMASLSRTRAYIVAPVLGLALLVGLSSTGLLAFAVSCVIWFIARFTPKAAFWIIGIATTILTLGLPFLLRALSAHRDRLAPLVKSSGLHRLEIWDYMSARILERPLTGWGLGMANQVPIRPEELANYLYVTPDGIYPHNQWIEAWLETGLPGVLLGLALVWLVLKRLSTQYQLAALSAALTVSMLNFEITTDSWWAAVAASALLFRQLPTRKI